jgi:hypothetical protein
VLRGAFGVEPSGWPSTEFGSEPTFFEVKRGDPGVGGSVAVNSPYVTREYQVCLKCHSNYAFNSPPPLGMSKGTTPPGTNAMYQYTNVAMEYQSPDSQRGEAPGRLPNNEGTGVPSPPQEMSTPSGAFKGVDGGGNTVNYLANNHRAWHPVVKPTGRTPAERGNANVNLWRSPFNISGGMGNQTMYCTDCRGAARRGTGQSLGAAWLEQ